MEKTEVKLLVWTQYFRPEHFIINDLAAELSKNGAQITVLTGKPNYPNGKLYPGYRAWGILKEMYNNVEVVRIPLIPRGSGRALRLAFNYLSFIISGYIMAPFVLRKRKYDAVFVYALSPLLQALPAIFIARLKSAPLIIWVQDVWPDALYATGFVKNKYLLKIVECLVRYIYRSADSILIQSEAFRTSIERLGADPKKIHFYPNAIADFLLPSKQVVKKTALVTEIEKCFSVVFAGNLGAAQSCKTIISAAQHLQDYPEVKIFLVGNGSQASALNAQINEHHLLNVVMAGHLPSDEMPAIYAAASVLLITLVNAPGVNDTVPSKLQSYLAAGKPIIGSINGEAAKIIINSESGFVCAAEDPVALALNIRKMFELPPDQRTKFGFNGREFFKKNYDLSFCTSKLFSHLETIIEQN